jgi:NADH:ubiquinone oxidoreductase subunit 3 (subunit A)
MKIKKQYIYIGLMILIIFTIGFFNLNNNKKIQPSFPKEVENKKEETQIISQIEAKPLSLPQIGTKPLSRTKTIKISLVVLDKKYEINVKEGSSVFEAMQKTEEDNSKEFNFKYTNYSSLGSFVNEINDVKGTPGKYWIYYINNEKASIGASKYILKQGDIINWKQEGI